jgi:sporulation protein YlmC with PRC-barrel domain
MELVRDVLDKQIVDRNGRPAGRVDGIVLEVRDGRPPRVVAIAVGPVVLGQRLHAAVGRWVEALQHGFGAPTPSAVIPWSEIQLLTDRMTIQVTGDAPASTLESRLRRWMRRLPGHK